MTIKSEGDSQIIGHFREVPPPAQAPVQSRAAELGLPDGLRVETSRSGGWRCACCGSMQRGETDQVWVPDTVQRHDPAWSVTEACRRNAYNGHFSGWCLGCASGFKGRPRVEKITGDGVALKRQSFWSRLFSWN